MSGGVLIARQDNVGDVLLAGPAIRAVAASGKPVTLLCGPRGKAGGELLPGVGELMVRRAEWIDPQPHPIDPGAIRAFVAEIERRAFEEAIILTSFHQSPLPLALLLRMAGVPRVAAISEDYPGSLLDVRHRPPDELHEVLRGLSLAQACGYELPDGDDGSLRVTATADPPAEVAALDAYLVVHPGASVPARAWSEGRHRELVRLLTGAGSAVVVTGSASERDLTGRVCAAGGGAPVVDLAGRTTLAELAGVIAGARAIVVGNTGPAHLAAAVGTPVVSLYAPTVPAVRWHPWKVPFELLHAEVPCAGCRARECPVPSHPCVEEIGAGDVIDALARLAVDAGGRGLAEELVA